MSIQIVGSGIERPPNRQSIGVGRLSSGKLELSGLLVSKFGMLLHLNLKMGKLYF